MLAACYFVIASGSLERRLPSPLSEGKFDRSSYVLLFVNFFRFLPMIDHCCSSRPSCLASKATSKGKKRKLVLEQAEEEVLNIASKAPSTANAAVQAGSTVVDFPVVSSVCFLRLKKQLLRMPLPYLHSGVRNGMGLFSAVAPGTRTLAQDI